jgi:hypothetical protein
MEYISMNWKYFRNLSTKIIPIFSENFGLSGKFWKYMFKIVLKSVENKILVFVKKLLSIREKSNSLGKIWVSLPNVLSLCSYAERVNKFFRPIKYEWTFLRIKTN